MPHRWASAARRGELDHRRRRRGGDRAPGALQVHANEEYALFTEFKAHGGRGVEVVTGSHSAAES